MKKHICLRFSRGGHYLYLGMHIPEKMETPELLKIIEASELIECSHSNGDINHNEHYLNSGSLDNRSLYDVHTNNLDKTLELIKNYNHKN